MVFLGLDPGITGAVALIDDHGTLLDARDLPSSSVTLSSGRVRRRIEPLELHRMLLDMIGGRTVTGVMEGVSASPQMGVTSAFSFGHTAGVIEAVAMQACQGNVITVSPNVWKRAMGVPACKATTMAEATQRWGDARWLRKGDHGRAEAALLAEYGRLLTRADTAGTEVER
jgi:crossover junction endodeoxyribonuclease RuvC